MGPSSLINCLVSEVRKELFSDPNIGIHTFVSPSAYDTAWLAMIPAENNVDNQNHCRPMFESCLNWVLENQNEEGFWGTKINEDGHKFPTIDALPATLACVAALKKWNQGHDNIDKGLVFIRSKTAEDILLTRKLPRWFILVFPAALELAEATGLELVFSSGLREGAIADIFSKRHQILEFEKKALKTSQPEFYLSYLETLPMPDSDFDEQEIIKQLNSDGSLFQSPSVTAWAFMATNNVNCIKYLQSLVQKFPCGGVPEKYPMDEELIKLCMVDHIQRLGLAEYFDKEIDQILDRIYRDQKERDSDGNGTLSVVPMPTKLFKDALAFRLLRIQGHYITPASFCWFLNDSKVMAYIQENSEEFINAMYSVYRATDLSFRGESELDEARAFARKILHNSIMVRNTDKNDFVISKGLQNVIKREMDVPWTASLDHLNYRMWIEENNMHHLWVGNQASFNRLSCLHNKKLAQLAVENYEFRQLIYRQELEEIKRWSEKRGLSKMGFGRDKTVYNYYAIAACSCHPVNSIMRLVMAKAATIVIFADDFYDMKGSLSELHLLTTAIQRWDGEGLTGHSKTIFDALDDFVNKFVANSPPHEGSKIVANIRNIWRETFSSWMVEKTWSLTGYIASMDEYLKIATISVAIHTIALPATSNFLNLTSSNGTQNLEYHEITKLLMAISRLLNDAQSYQREEEEGKMNFVHLHMKQNPNPKACIADSVAHVKQILELKMKEFMEHVFIDDSMPKSCRQLHLSCMKLFHMLYNSANNFDSETALVDDIEKAIYLPIGQIPEPETKLLEPNCLISPDQKTTFS